MITQDIFYLGVDDKTIDLFEGQYLVPNGISYNSYLILDEKAAVLDTVDARKTEEYLAKLEQALGGRTPDYLVVHHVEPDHASSIQAVVEKYPSVQLVASAKALQMLPQYFESLDLSGAIAVKDGDVLQLGRHSLTFMAAPMVHWPEVMVSYEPTSKTLFSADGFGKFGALDTQEEWDCEARRYYFNIVGKFGPQVQALLKKAASLQIERICPLHGPILEENLGHYLNLYDIWSRYEPETDGVFIAYASLHGNTAKAAQKLADILKQKGCAQVEMADLARSDMAEALENAFRYSKVVLAASSYNGGVMPFMEDLLHHLAAKNYQKRRVGLVENGSFGPCANRTMQQLLSGMKEIDLVEPAVTIRGAVKESDIPALEALADALLA
ncbi:MAG: MBL fold metallo-hydrolase [Pygmaiobacter massiliensis]|nr:MBL fold metallo-hydrolase [Pygmaiobacter massiliensis]